MKLKVNEMFNHGELKMENDGTFHVVLDPLEQQMLKFSHYDDDESQIKAAALKQ